jgi:hypothetical protein
MLPDKTRSGFTLQVGEISVNFLLAGTDSQPTSQTKRTISPPEAGDRFVFRVHQGSMPDVRVEKTIFNGSNWALYRNQDRLVLQDTGFHTGALPQERVILDLTKREGDIFIRDDASHGELRSSALGYPLDQLLMILLLAEGKGLLYHGCAIEGKSTMAKVWSAKGARVLNDDRVVVGGKKEGFWMYGTPWHGDFKSFSTRGLPISKIFFLFPDKENRLIPQEGAKAVSMLLTRSFPPLWDKAGMNFSVGFCHRFVSAVPCYEFHFKQDQSVINFIRNAG